MWEKMGGKSDESGLHVHLRVGHRGTPDKLCDQISDAIVDRFLRQGGPLHGRGPGSRAIVECAVSRHFDFLLAGIIRQFNLRALPSTVKGGFYRKLAAYGHVGRMDIGLPWE